MKFTNILTIGILFFLYTSASSMEIHNKCEEKDYIETESGSYDDDYLFVGSELNFSGKAEDLIFLGKTLTFRGKTDLGVVAAGKKILYSGESGNGIMTGGMNVIIDGKSRGNSYVAGKSVHLTETGEVKGTLFLGCARGTIDGVIDGDLYAGAGELSINNEINGNVKIYGGRIHFGDKGKINGNLIYGTKEKLSDKDLAKVTGTVTFDEEHHFDMDGMIPDKTGKMLQIIFGIGMFVSFIAVGCLLLFIPVFRNLDTEQPEKKFWYTSLWGLIPLLMYPAVIVLCFVLIVTLPLGLGMILAFIPLAGIAYIIGTTLVGKYIVRKLKWKVNKRHYQFLIGAVAAIIISIIPFINFLAFIFISALGFGTYLSFLFKRELVAA